MQRTSRRSAAYRLSAQNHPRVRMNVPADSAAWPSQILVGFGGRAQRPRLVALLALCGFCVLFLAFFFTDIFYVQTPTVIGLESLTEEDVIGASRVVNYSIFFIDPRSIERAVSKLPEVESVHVSVSLPNVVTIAVTERTPEVLWRRGAEMYWLDANGTALEARGTLQDLTTVRDLDQAPVTIGEKIAPAAIGALQALRSVWPDGPRLMEWSKERGLAFTDERGWKIYLGDENGMASKVNRLRVLVPQLVAQKAQLKFIDLGKGDPYYQ